MRVKYVGMFEEVTVPEHDEARTIARGEPVEVGDEIGARLLEQAGQWELVGVPAGLRRSSSGARPETAGSTAAGE